MNFKHLFVVPPHVPAAQAALQADAAAGGGTPVFITPQSLATFPGASLAVLVIWKTLGLLTPALGSSNWVPFIASLVVGVVIYLVSITANMTSQDKLVGLFLGILNSFYIALFVIGVPLTFSANPGLNPATPTTPPAVHTQQPGVAPIDGGSRSK